MQRDFYCHDLNDFFAVFSSNYFLIKFLVIPKFLGLVDNDQSDYDANVSLGCGFIVLYFFVNFLPT